MILYLQSAVVFSPACYRPMVTLLAMVPKDGNGSDEDFCEIRYRYISMLPEGASDDLHFDSDDHTTLI